jgi:pyruvyltransferase
MTKVYWWRPEPDYNGLGALHLRGPATRNFGDQLNEFVMTQMGLDYEWANPSAAELVMCGSILEHLPDYWAGTVCGSGKLHESSRVRLTDARVLALRGKLTLAGAVLPPGCKPVLGDIGLLVPEWVRQPGCSYPLGVLPHHGDTDLARKYSYGRIIDPTWPVHKVIEEIGRCRRIVTSSLHGAVVADAYQIPRQLELPPDPRGKEGGDFKFRDYATLYDGNPHFGEVWTAPRKRVEEIRRDLLEALRTAVGIDLGQDRRDPQVSLLVPFRDDGEHRSRVWKWLRQRWRIAYPDAEIVMGRDASPIFCKAAAVNDAASRARGRTLVILDADTWLPPATVSGCADRIDAARTARRRAWFMPYDRIHRLSHETTLGLLDAEAGVEMPLPPPRDWCEEIGEGSSSMAHSFGALAQIMPREAFLSAQGMDERFSEGWGGEDGSFLRALDTVWKQHEVVSGDAVHLWHATRGNDWRDRKWAGQTRPNANSRLSHRYTQAASDPGAMRGLCDEHPLEWA